MTNYISKFVRRLNGLVKLGIIICIVLPVLGCFGRYYWVLDLFSHFRVQYCVLLLLGGLFLFIIKRRRWAMISLGVGILLGSTMIKYYIPASEVSSEDGFKIISFNVSAANDRHHDIMRYLLEEDADLILLMEVNRTRVRHLKGLKEKYPYQLDELRKNNYGIIMYSKRDFVVREKKRFGEMKAPFLSVLLNVDGKLLSISGSHPLSPRNSLRSIERSIYLDDVVKHVNSCDAGNLIVVGDFNISPFSYYYEKFLDDTKLRDSSIGFGIESTWKKKWPLISVAIDHAFVSNGITVLNKYIGRSIGSDHNAMIVEIKLP